MALCHAWRLTTALWVLALQVAPTSSHLRVTSAARAAEGDLQATECLTLDGREIACRSAAEWLPAQILVQRGRSMVQLFSEEDAEQRQAAAALFHFLCLQAQHQRDIGAASGLRAYYTRIALAEQLALTGRSLELIESEQRKLQAVQSAGLATGTDLSSFDRHRLDIQDNQLQVLAKDRQLKVLLAEMARIDYEMSQTCQEELEVAPGPLDCQRLTSLALQQRKDLQSWIYLFHQVNEDSAAIFAQMLGSLVGNFGMPIPKIFGLKQLLCPPDYGPLAANMRYELQLIIETHHRWITQAIAEKCAALELAYGRLEIAGQTIQSWEGRIDQLVAAETQGNPRPQQLAAARTSLFKAQADEISRRLDAKLAEIDLAEACGAVHERCCQGQPWLLTGID